MNIQFTMVMCCKKKANADKNGGAKFFKDFLTDDDIRKFETS